MKKRQNGKKTTSLAVLALILCFTLMPFSAFAEDFAEGDPINDGEPAVTVEQEDVSVDSEPAAVTEEVAEEVQPESETEEDTLVEDEPESVVQDEPGDPECQHKWNLVESITPPTATAEGWGKYECELCHATKEAEIPPTSGTAKSFTLDGNKLSFNSPFATQVPAYMSGARIPRTWIKAAKKSITINWNLPKDMSRVTGVVILRKTGKEKTYKEIKRIQFRQSDGSLNLSNSFKDTKAKKKNTPYSYIVVSYYSDALSGKNFVSHCSDWAAGQTSNSKLKNAYTAKINKTSASLQVKGTVKLKLTHKKPKTIYNSKSFRWYSDNTSIAKVSSKGVVTAVKPGTTTIRGRLPSGSEKTCKVTVVGAFKPSTPKIRVDVASNTTITLVWTKASHANSYLLYRSDDGINWNSPKTVKTTTYKDSGLTHNHRYTYYVVAVNNNAGYTAKSGNSNVIYQKAVIVRRKTTLSGWPTSKSVRSGNTYSVTVTIGSPDSRKGYLQMKSGSKWVTKKTFNLKKGAGTQKLKVTFPNDWWGKTTSWRFHIPKNNTSEEYTTKTLKIKSTRRYQNPSKYVQISDTISKHGYSYYVSSVLVNGNSTKSDHIEALIKTANKYKGHKYKESGSGKPSSGVDSSGLVIQACYGAGVDLWPISPSTRPYNCVPKIRSSKLGKPSSPSRGDLVFFYLPGSSTIGHVGIYLGSGKIIHASQERGVVESTTVDRLVNEDGYKICDYRRIFN